MAKPIYILGVTGFSEYHDNSAALVRDGEVVFAVAEERLTRKKHEAAYPSRAIAQALKFAGIKYEDLAGVASGWPKRSLKKMFMKPHLMGDVATGLADLAVNANWRLMLWLAKVVRRERVAAEGVKGVFFAERNEMKSKRGESSGLPFDKLRDEARKDKQVSGFDSAQSGTDEIATSPKYDNENKERLLAMTTESKVYSVDHHRAHAVAAYANCGWEECLTVTLDGFGATPEGDLRSGSVWVCSDGEMREAESLPIESSLGLFYEAVTVALGFRPADGEGKTMGLAAYGKPETVYREMRQMAPRFANGKWVKNPRWLDAIFSVDLKYKPVFMRTRMGRRLEKLMENNGKEQVAAAAQRVLEEEAEKFFIYLSETYKMKKIAASGGVFLNVKMNKIIRQLPGIEEIFVYPNAGDGGVAAGAALIGYEEVLNQKSKVISQNDKEKFREKQSSSPMELDGRQANIKSLKSKRLESTALGVEYSDKEIREILKKLKSPTSPNPLRQTHSQNERGNEEQELRGAGKIKYEKKKDIAKYVGKALTQGKVVGWFQGREEWGPRALGQRSVLADPRNEKVKERINSLMKKRDWFMPFAPAVTEERVKEWFVDGYPDAFMTMAFDVVKGKEKLIPAAIHIDGTARPQVVKRKVNPKYWQVIAEFEKLTGVPVILNTSFNKHGLPIVHSPDEAIEHLLWGCVDDLVMGDYIVRRLEKNSP